jgi:hypothetical protein
MKWEYLVFTEHLFLKKMRYAGGLNSFEGIIIKGLSLNGALDYLGKKGWEMVSMTTCFFRTKYAFKRQIKSD